MARPVHHQLLDAARQHRAGQVLHRDPRQQQEAAVVDHVLQIPRPSPIVPADPAVPRRHAPGRARELQAADHRAGRPRRKHQIAQLGAERDRVPEVVVASHQLPEQQALGRLAHPLDSKRLDVAHAAHQRGPRLARRRVGNAGDRTARAALPLVRQHQRTIRVEPLEELPALPRLQPPVRAPPPQQLAHGARQLHPAQARTLAHDLADQRHLLHAERTSRERRRRHGHQQVSPYPTTPYQNAARMSRGTPERTHRGAPGAGIRSGWRLVNSRAGALSSALSPRKPHRRGSVRERKRL